MLSAPTQVHVMNLALTTSKMAVSLMKLEDVKQLKEARLTMIAQVEAMDRIIQGEVKRIADQN